MKTAGRLVEHLIREKPASNRAAILEAEQRGDLPAAPDFSASTYARFRKKLGELTALIEAGDFAARKAFPINPYSSSPKEALYETRSEEGDPRLLLPGSWLIPETR